MEELKQQIMDTYNEIADDFDPTRPHPWPETVEFVKTVEECSRVIDLGCGNGRNSVYLAQQGLQVVGVDFAINMLKIANQKETENRPISRASAQPDAGLRHDRGTGTRLSAGQKSAL